ncbi:hypothetical protein PAN31117_05083 [Pandoraea anapnoica]|uniref:Uncharacterized protein n=1 Tax=Pandoraea anapnoica TaxID=2508301 RepID=A0A5E5AN26_9BURK|nr:MULTISPECIES: hypothetical protein [Pandoraea]VVE58526.1 hypothetical protein PIN31009_05317 [Pandoraea iniqua]VVE75109.1 hypothetical protein PAN31117_05083 [Pandoraea anapnoica]
MGNIVPSMKFRMASYSTTRIFLDGYAGKDEVRWESNVPGVTFDPPSGFPEPGTGRLYTWVNIENTNTQDLEGTNFTVTATDSHGAYITSSRCDVRSPNNFVVMLNRRWAYTSNTPSEYKAEDQSIEVHLTLENPMVNNRYDNYIVDFTPRGGGNFAVMDSDFNMMRPDPELDYFSYFVITEEPGVAKINLAAHHSTGIFSIEAGFGKGHTSDAKDVVFISKQPDAGTLPPPKLNLDSNDQLNLDKESPQGVRVWVDRADISGVDLNMRAVLIVNNKMVGDIFTLWTLSNGLYLSPAVFSEKQGNAIYWMGTSAEGETVASSVRSFTVIGNAYNHPPTDGTLQRPMADDPTLQVIDEEALADGDGFIQFDIPNYAGMKSGDQVTLNCYINAFYGGTDTPHNDKVTVTVSAGSNSVPPCKVSSLQLSGFSRSKSGVGESTFECYYTVSRAGANFAYSLPMSPKMKIDT